MAEEPDLRPQTLCQHPPGSQEHRPLGGPRRAHRLARGVGVLDPRAAAAAGSVWATEMMQDTASGGRHQRGKRRTPGMRSGAGPSPPRPQMAASLKAQAQGMERTRADEVLHTGRKPVSTQNTRMTPAHATDPEEVHVCEWGPAVGRGMHGALERESKTRYHPQFEVMDTRLLIQFLYHSVCLRGS